MQPRWAAQKDIALQQYKRHFLGVECRDRFSVGISFEFEGISNA